MCGGVNNCYAGRNAAVTYGRCQERDPTEEHAMTLATKTETGGDVKNCFQSHPMYQRPVRERKRGQAELPPIP